MARVRQIKPGYFSDDDVAVMSIHARLLFIGLWGMADREGRLEDKPIQIKIHVLPLDNVDPNALLEELVAHRHIQRYEANGHRYIQIRTFERHQNPHPNETKSEIPPPDKQRASTNGKSADDISNSTRADPGSRNTDPGSRIPDSPPACARDPGAVAPSTEVAHGIAEGGEPEDPRDRAPAAPLPSQPPSRLEEAPPDEQHSLGAELTERELGNAISLYKAKLTAQWQNKRRDPYVQDQGRDWKALRALLEQLPRDEWPTIPERHALYLADSTLEWPRGHKHPHWLFCQEFNRYTPSGLAETKAEKAKPRASPAAKPYVSPYQDFDKMPPIRSYIPPTAGTPK